MEQQINFKDCAGQTNKGKQVSKHRHTCDIATIMQKVERGRKAQEA